MAEFFEVDATKADWSRRPRYLSIDMLPDLSDEEREKLQRTTSEAFEMMVRFLMGEMNAHNAPNYYCNVFEVQAEGEDVRYELTLKRYHGKSPTQLVGDLKEELGRVQTRAARALLALGDGDTDKAREILEELVAGGGGP